LSPQGFKFADWELRLRSRSLISAAGHEVGLTKSEFALLLALLKRPRQIMSREQIMDLTQAEDDVFDRAIDVQMLRLRRKVEASSRAHAAQDQAWRRLFSGCRCAGSALNPHSSQSLTETTGPGPRPARGHA
jgi:membrane carboxypeptidase/penicillin-binding protein PbpC